MVSPELNPQLNPQLNPRLNLELSPELNPDTASPDADKEALMAARKGLVRVRPPGCTAVFVGNLPWQVFLPRCCRSLLSLRKAAGLCRRVRGQFLFFPGRLSFLYVVGLFCLYVVGLFCLLSNMLVGNFFKRAKNKKMVSSLPERGRATYIYISIYSFFFLYLGRTRMRCDGTFR
jgi:hypothetical protein